MNDLPVVEIDLSNEFGLIMGRNLANHSTSMAGRGSFVQITDRRTTFRTKQEVYRFVTYLQLLAQEIALPDEEGEHSQEEVYDAIKEYRNSLV